MCVEVLDREDDEDEQDEAGEQDRGEVEVGNSSALNG